jgi:type IV pilus assembly protein PilF
MLGLSEAESYSRMKWAAERAIGLDDESVAAHTSFAVALWWQRNWPGALRELRRALELNPGDAMARSWYSLLLRGMGRSGEAHQESRRAYELDPFAVVISGTLGWHCYMMRNYDCAIEQQRRTLGVGIYPNSHIGLGLALAKKGQTTEAIEQVEQAMSLAPQRREFRADLAYLQALAGRTAEARATLRGASRIGARATTLRAPMWASVSRTARSRGSSARAGSGRTEQCWMTRRWTRCARTRASRSSLSGLRATWGCGNRAGTFCRQSA